MKKDTVLAQIEKIQAIATQLRAEIYSLDAIHSHDALEEAWATLDDMIIPNMQVVLRDAEEQFAPRERLVVHYFGANLVRGTV